MHSFRQILIAAAMAMIGPAAFAQQSDQAATAPAPMQNMPGAADKAMMAGMQTMSRDMSAAPMTGDPDRDFVAMMIPHHQGAIDMAKVELQYGKDTKMRQLARNIVAAQEKEIKEMHGWQSRHPVKR